MGRFCGSDSVRPPPPGGVLASHNVVTPPTSSGARAGGVNPGSLPKNGPLLRGRLCMAAGARASFGSCTGATPPPSSGARAGGSGRAAPPPIRPVFAGPSLSGRRRQGESWRLRRLSLQGTFPRGDTAKGQGHKDFEARTKNKAGRRRNHSVGVPPQKIPCPQGVSGGALQVPYRSESAAERSPHLLPDLPLRIIPFTVPPIRGGNGGTVNNVFATVPFGTLSERFGTLLTRLAEQACIDALGPRGRG
jgi:hypothetical protein